MDSTLRNVALVINISQQIIALPLKMTTSASPCWPSFAFGTRKRDAKTQQQQQTTLNNHTTTTTSTANKPQDFHPFPWAHAHHPYALTVVSYFTRAIYTGIITPQIRIGGARQAATTQIITFTCMHACVRLCAQCVRIYTYQVYIVCRVQHFLG